MEKPKIKIEFIRCQRNSHCHSQHFSSCSKNQMANRGKTEKQLNKCNHQRRLQVNINISIATRGLQGPLLEWQLEAPLRPQRLRMRLQRKIIKVKKIISQRETNAIKQNVWQQPLHNPKASGNRRRRCQDARMPGLQDELKSDLKWKLKQQKIKIDTHSQICLICLLMQWAFCNLST